MLRIPAHRWATLLLLAAGCGGRSLDYTGNDAGGGGTVTTDGGNARGGGSTSDGGSVIVTSSDGGLLPPNEPGYVSCGSVTCGPDDHCCLTPQGDPATNGCASRSSALCNGTQDVRDCARQADCHPDEVCCYEVFTTPPATLGSRCVALAQEACGGGYEFVGCGSDADCAGNDAGACVVQRCRGDLIQTCGELPSDMCTP